MSAALRKSKTAPPKILLKDSEKDVAIQFGNQCLLFLAAPLVDETNLPLQQSPTLLCNELDTISTPFSDRHVPLVIRSEYLRAGADVALSEKDQPVFMHVTTHGYLSEGTFFLATETATGKLHLRKKYEIYDIFGSLGLCLPQLAVLNVCHSEPLAEVLVDMGIPHVVAIDADEAVLTQATNVFCKCFYAKLLDGLSVAQSFERARDAVLSDPTVGFIDRAVDEYLKILLLPLGSSHNKVIDFEKGPGFVDYPSWTNTNLPRIEKERLIGRNEIIWQLNELLIEPPPNHRIVVMYGFGGFGKTVICRAVARWQHERNWWPDGVWFIDARDLYSTVELASKLRTSVPPLSNNCSKCLLILDDLDLLNQRDSTRVRDLIIELCERYPRLKLLITIRHIGDAPDIGGHTRLHLDPLRKDVVFDVFKHYLRGAAPWVHDDRQFVNQRQWLIEFLSGYPLAIKLAASVISKKGIGLDDYRKRVDENRLAMFTDPVGGQNRENSLKVSLLISYEAMPSRARDVYPILAFFPSGMSETLIESVFGSDLERFEDIYEYSMVEVEREQIDSRTAIRRFRLPHPARIFAEDVAMRITPQETYGNKILNYYGDVISKWVSELETAVADEKRLNPLAERPDSPAMIHDQLLDIQLRRQIALNVLWSENSNIQLWIKWGLTRGKTSRLKACMSIMSRVAVFWAHVSNSDQDYGLDMLGQAKAIAEEDGDTNATGLINEALGEFYTRRNKLEIAKHCFLNAMACFTSELDLARIRVALSGLCGKEERHEHLLSASQIYRSKEERVGLSDCLRALAQCQYELGRVDDARTTLSEWKEVETVAVAKLLGLRDLAQRALAREDAGEAAFLYICAIESSIKNGDFQSLRDDINAMANWGILRGSADKVAAIVETAKHSTVTGSENHMAMGQVLDRLRSYTGN